MVVTQTVFETLLTYLESHLATHVLHIAGPNACGKSTFIHDFLQFLIPRLPPAHIYYIDTEQKFNLARYRPNPIFQNMKYTHISNIPDLNRKVQLWLSGITPLNKGDIVIIDSLSELCKNVIAQTESWHEYLLESKQLYHDLIAPLVRLITHNEAWLFCTHHAVYSPLQQGSSPAFNDFAHMIPGLWILMALSPNQTPESALKVMQLVFEHKIAGKLKQQIKVFSRNYLYRLGESLEICEEIPTAFNNIE